MIAKVLNKNGRAIGLKDLRGSLWRDAGDTIVNVDDIGISCTDSPCSLQFLSENGIVIGQLILPEGTDWTFKIPAGKWTLRPK